MDCKPGARSPPSTSSTAPGGRNTFRPDSPCSRERTRSDISTPRSRTRALRRRPTHSVWRTRYRRCPGRWRHSLPPNMLQLLRAPPSTRRHAALLLSSMASVPRRGGHAVEGRASATSERMVSEALRRDGLPGPRAPGVDGAHHARLLTSRDGARARAHPQTPSSRRASRPRQHCRASPAQWRA